MVMNKRLGCILGGIFILGGLIFLVVLGMLYFRHRQERVGFQSSIPVVYITEPAASSSFPAGSYIGVAATAVGKNPIARVELWLDDELKETQQSIQPGGSVPPVGNTAGMTPAVQPGGAPTFYANFALLIPSEGPHTLFVRAVDVFGVIGQSLPIGILGNAKAVSGEVLMLIRVNEGQTLEDVANAYGSDPATLQSINPTLGGQEPASGAVIKVPLAPEQEKPETKISPPSTQPQIKLPDVPMLTIIQPSLLPVDLGGLVPMALPLPPTDLKGQVANCEVTLGWNDNADDEKRYEVWTAWMGITPQLVAELNPSPTKGPAWYKFRSPQTGWIPFWVEAVSAKGRQPSNTITLYVDPQKCEWSQGSGQYLTVQVFEMTVKDNSDKVYCYVSYENNPEQRIPEQSDKFIQVKGGKANFAGAAVGAVVSGPNSVLIPIPLDGALDVAGKCYGWAGNNLHDLGNFGASFTTLDWDGARRTIKGAAYNIEFAIKPWTPAVEAAMLGKYWYEDPTLPAPWGLSIHQLYAPGGNVDPRERQLKWNWDGDAKLIQGFQVFIDGKPYGYFAGANNRSADVFNPFYCGHTVHWQVAAVSGVAQSPPSAIFENVLPNCKTFVTVKFESVSWLDTKDGFKPWAQWQPCDSLDLYYSLGLNGTKKEFGWSPSFGVGCTNCVQNVACGGHSFLDLGSFYSSADPNPDTLVVSIDTNEIAIKLWADFWDYDWGSGDDRIAYHVEELWYPSLQKAQEELGCGKEFISDAKVLDSAGLSTIWYKVAVYPNACSDFPLGVPLPQAP
jgi:hypothetical protein